MAPGTFVVIATVLMTTQAFWDAISRRLVNNYWRLGAARSALIFRVKQSKESSRAAKYGQLNVARNGPTLHRNAGNY